MSTKKAQIVMASTIVGAIGAIILFIFWGNVFSVKQEYTVTATKITISLNVEIWGTTRHYNRSSAPECAWDIDKDLVCTEYQKICTGYSDGICTAYVDGPCISWDYEYDYSQREWLNFRTFDTSVINSPIAVMPWHPKGANYRIASKKTISYADISRGDKVKVIKSKNPDSFYTVGQKVMVKKAWGKLFAE